METTPLADRGPLPGGPANDAGPGASLQEQHVIAKVSRHLLWFLFILFFFSFLDRINIGFAGLTMMKDLGLSGVQFGLATTLFYVAYIAFGIPSNIVLARIGAQEMDRDHHDRLGSGIHGDHVCVESGHALPVAHFGRRDGGRFSARHPALHDLLVSQCISRESECHVHDRHAGDRCDRLRALGIPPGTGWDARAQRVAMAVFSGRIAFGDPWVWSYSPICATPLKRQAGSARMRSVRLSQTLAAEHKPIACRARRQPKKEAFSANSSRRRSSSSRCLFLPRQHARDGGGLDAADRQELQRRRQQSHRRAARCDPANLHDRRHDLVGKALRSQAGTQMAPDAADAVLSLLAGSARLTRPIPSCKCWGSAWLRQDRTPRCRSSGRRPITR